MYFFKVINYEVWVSEAKGSKESALVSADGLDLQERQIDSGCWHRYGFIILMEMTSCNDNDPFFKIQQS